MQERLRKICASVFFRWVGGISGDSCDEDFRDMQMAAYTSDKYYSVRLNGSVRFCA